MYRLVALPGRSSEKDGSLLRRTRKRFCEKNAKNKTNFGSFGSSTVLTSFGLKVGYAVHNYMMQEQRLVVDFYVSREKAIEVLHIPADRKKEVCEICSPHLTHPLRER